MSSMSPQAKIQQARAIAMEAHQGQADKTGEPFIAHVERVADGVEGEDQTIVAWLHDVVEKAPGWSFARLRQAGFSDDVIDAVDAMTKRAGEDYLDFCRRAVANPLARPVKRADLLDNIAQVRRMGGDTGKYEQGLRILHAQETGGSEH